MNGKVIIPRNPFERFRDEHSRCCDTLSSVYTYIVMNASYTGDIGVLQTTQQKMRWNLKISRQRLRTALDILHSMRLICCGHSVTGHRYTGTKISVIDYEKNHRSFNEVTNQPTNQSPTGPKDYKEVQPINQPTVFKQSIKAKDLNAQSLNTTVVNTRAKEEDKSAPISHEIVKDQKPTDLDSLESVFILEDSETSPYIGEYHNLIAWFYGRCMEFGWRDRPPPMGTQMRQVKILLDYERDGYKLWAMQKMVRWQVERRRRRGRPMVSFDFFDMHKARYLTPMQEALLATRDDQKPTEDLHPRIKEMCEQIAPTRKDEIAERNRQFLDQAARDRYRQQTRKAIMQQLDPPDMTVPTVDDLKGTTA